MPTIPSKRIDVGSSTVGGWRCHSCVVDSSRAIIQGSEADGRYRSNEDRKRQGAISKKKKKNQSRGKPAHALWESQVSQFEVS